MSDSPVLVNRLKDSMSDFFVSKYKGLFTRWLRGAKSRAEIYFNGEVDKMKAAKWPLSEGEVHIYLYIL
jgi:hypothetical protein